MFFWFSILVITVVCTGAVWRSWTRHLGVDVSEAGSDSALYQIRLKEIEQDLKEGRLDEETAQAAKNEESRRLLRANRTKDDADEAAARPSGWWMTSALVAIPAISLSLYFALGTPPSSSVAPQPQQAEAGQTTQSIDELVATAERRLEEKPDDLRGWQVLAPVYLRQNNLDKAETAFRNILRLEGPSTLVLSTLGEILVAKTQGIISDEALGFFEQAIELDASNADAQFFTGMAAFQRDDINEARTIWQGMIDNAEGNEEWLESMRARLAALENVPANNSPVQIPEDQRPQIESMVAGLAARLEENPDDKQGWERLVRAYIVLELPEEAAEAVDNARATFGQDEVFMAGLEAMLGDNKTSGETGAGE